MHSKGYNYKYNSITVLIPFLIIFKKYIYFNSIYMLWRSLIIELSIIFFLSERNFYNKNFLKCE